ncbi:MAG: DUF6165 family protein [Kiloniellales bacterium]|jgi:hypothetical protein
MPDAKNAKGLTVSVEVSPGELIDKITILEIKSERIADPDKLANVRHELELLRGIRAARLREDAELARLAGELKQVNETLWQIEDDIRDCERAKDFGPRFVELARSVYRANDRRAALKREVGELFGGAIVEEKSYSEY